MTAYEQYSWVCIGDGERVDYSFLSKVLTSCSLEESPRFRSREMSVSLTDHSEKPLERLPMDASSRPFVSCSITPTLCYAIS